MLVGPYVSFSERLRVDLLFSIPRAVQKDLPYLAPISYEAASAVGGADLIGKRHNLADFLKHAVLKPAVTRVSGFFREHNLPTVSVAKMITTIGPKNSKQLLAMQQGFNAAERKGWWSQRFTGATIPVPVRVRLVLNKEGLMQSPPQGQLSVAVEGAIPQDSRSWGKVRQFDFWDGLRRQLSQTLFVAGDGGEAPVAQSLLTTPAGQALTPTTPVLNLVS
jgi:hypothetical protein